jgi:predicted DNA-binding protein YlxM (UPF0122 family)
MSEPDFQTLLDFFKGLANESRLKIVGLLAQQERSVEELAALLELKEPTVSHHLKKLKELKLVNMRPEGNTHFYQLNQTALQELSKAVFSTPEIATKSHPVEDWETKILQRYMEDGRLREIPSSRKKRWVILKWLVQQFEMGDLYPERSLNEIIKQIHPDTATLRREMVGYRMMERENGVYWRVPESQWREELKL